MPSVPWILNPEGEGVAGAATRITFAFPPMASPTPAPIPESTIVSTTFTSLSSQVPPYTSSYLDTVSAHLPITFLRTPTSITSTFPISSPTFVPVPEGIIVAASIGGTLSVVALLAVFITVYFRYRPQKPVLTPYYERISTRRPFTTVQHEIKLGPTTHTPLTPIKAQGSAPPQHSCFPLTSRSDCDVDGDNVTLCVPEDKSTAARRRRERELEKLYPIRPHRGDGEYGVASADTDTESLCADLVLESRGISH
ncbi:hypothetical protein PAXRUDRAFT_12787 [Paxillus rubicundulus Ve08.2h10]|uniref:Unplaced genomic scaffold scaffold_382, whole genome shotgun sequence n=1 Tax=Paxillus rubicundulus Ve08.2h10 TaxID=930991 RepID=A0A0D0E0C9_9AGAM|nr:hypothetical protein PAXRUDRAFT_12787 [Paxillus rubicundulus Ve08.2h10]